MLKTDRLITSAMAPRWPRRGRGALLAAAAAALLISASLAHAGEPPAIKTIEYRIKKGDTCAGIARAMYGQPGRWDVIHEFNPQLGPDLPHRLQAGEVLRLPPELPPDAWVTAVTRRVEHREAPTVDWRPAPTGTALAEGHRVSTMAQSAAELTFRDRSEVELQQNTLLILYGRTSDEVRQRPQRVTLERGALRSRLAGLRGAATPEEGGLAVSTVSAVAEMGDGAALMSVDDAGLSCVSNFDGEPIAVSAVGLPGAVTVPQGMGTRVERGRRPSAPRPLPPAPLWRQAEPETVFGATGADAIVRLAWSPAGAAAAYRLEVADAQGQRITAVELGPDEVQTRIVGLPSGRYTLSISMTSREGLSSKPSRPKTLVVEAVTPETALFVGDRVGGCATAERPEAPEAVLRSPGPATLICGDRSIEVRVDGVQFTAEPGGRPGSWTVTARADRPLPADLGIVGPPGVSIGRMRTGDSPTSGVVPVAIGPEVSRPVSLTVLRGMDPVPVGAVKLEGP